jgi:hypothetical protein
MLNKHLLKLIVFSLFLFTSSVKSAVGIQSNDVIPFVIAQFIAAFIFIVITKSKSK